MSKQDVKYIDGTGLVLGRLGSWLAKRLLAGERIVVVNAQDILISGNKDSLFKDYHQRRARATHTNPRKGPFFPRFPDRILRRSVRGMLPWRRTSGRLAYRRLSAYIQIPEDLKDKEFITVPETDGRNLRKYTTVGELAKRIGWTHEERV